MKPGDKDFIPIPPLSSIPFYFPVVGSPVMRGEVNLDGREYEVLYDGFGRFTIAPIPVPSSWYSIWVFPCEWEGLVTRALKGDSPF